MNINQTSLANISEQHFLNQIARPAFWRFQINVKYFELVGIEPAISDSESNALPTVLMRFEIISTSSPSRSLCFHVCVSQLSTFC